MALFGDYVRGETLSLTGDEFSELVDYLSREDKLSMIRGPYKTTNGASMSQETLDAFAEEAGKWNISDIELRTTLVNQDKKKITKKDWEGALRRPNTYMIVNGMSARKRGKLRHIDYETRSPQDEAERKSSGGSSVIVKDVRLSPRVASLMIQKYSHYREHRRQEGLEDVSFEDFVEVAYPATYRRFGQQVRNISEMRALNSGPPFIDI